LNNTLKQQATNFKETEHHERAYEIFIMFGADIRHFVGNLPSHRRHACRCRANRTLQDNGSDDYSSGARATT